MSERISTEAFFRVYDDDNGAYYEIRPDADGIECVELRYSHDGSKSESITIMSGAFARAVAAAMVRVADELDAEHKRQTG